MSQKLVALGRITAGVAHEVNNPLAGLLNCIDTLRNHPDNPKLIDRYLPVIDQGLHRIKDIVQNLLVGLKVEEGEEIVELDHIDKLYYLMKAEIGDRAITIDWKNELGPEVPVSAKLEQIVCNLLKNSIEALGEQGLIYVRIYTEGEYLTVQIKDNGPGIPINLRNQLFDPFFTTKSNGTGLGLWVVYRQTQSLKGIIEFESDETGTSFYVTVPVVTRKVA
ncbi:MAG: HAMP domain-containing histidine kinase [Gammaproteobacteria bacterium]|nr:HAMP domain-containing histidine kinase [Gammaproteobacteria bacterium]